MQKIMLALALAWCTLPAIAQQKISGIVTSEGEPVSTAKITLSGTMLSAFSGAGGKYELSGVKPGVYELTVEALWHKKYVQAVTVTDQDLTLDVVLETDAQLMEAVSILAIRANHYSAQSYNEMNKEDIRENNLGQDMPYILNQTPSVVVTSDAGAGVGYTGIRIRGSDATRVNITINGIPLNDAESQGTFWVNLPDFASSADNIQIQRGVGTSTNGAGAFGGTVNVNTNTVKANPYGELHNSFGSFNTMRNTIAFGSGLINNKFTFDGRLSNIVSDGFIDRSSSDLKSFYTSAAYIGRKANLRLNVFSGKEKTQQAWYGIPSYKLNGDRAGMTDFYYRNLGYMFNTPADSVNFFTSGNRKYNLYNYKDQTDNYNQTQYQLFWNQRFSKQFYTGITLYHTRGKGFYEEYKYGQDFMDYGMENVVAGTDTLTSTNLVRRRWLDNYLYGANIALNYESSRVKSTLGGGYNIYTGNHFGEITWAQYASNSEIGQKYYDNDATKTDLNVFTKNTVLIAKGLSAYVDLQLRTVGHKFLGLDNTLQATQQTVSYTFFNPKAGVTYDFKKHSAYASFGIGNREPARSDFVEATPSNYPQAEQLQDVEAGYTYNGRKFGLGFNLYYMNYKNQLVLTGKVNDVGAYIRQNIAASYRQGVELQFTWKPVKPVEWSANITLSQNKVKNFTEYIDTYDASYNYSQTVVQYGTTDISFSPGVIAGSDIQLNLLTLETRTKARDENNPMRNIFEVKLNLLSKYVGDQYLDNTSNPDRMLAAYYTQDVRLRIAYKTNTLKEISLNVQAMNLFDTKYSSNGYVYPNILGGQLYNDVYYYPQAGRYYLAGISLLF